jgi:dienelactone hydrolase
MKEFGVWMAGLLVLVLVAATELNVQAAAEPAALAERFVDLLAKEDFAAAVARFDATMKSALPEPQLREAWQSTTNQAGPFKQRLHSRALKFGAYDVVLVTCEFDRTRLDVKVALNSKSEVSGLYFVPSTDERAVVGPPPYANTNAFREQPFTVGSGEWSLPGTLTLPVSGQARVAFPAVILVHGSGPNDRDESVGAVKPFRDLAWGLATKGISVLRYEKRTKEHAAKFMQPENLRLTLREETIDDAVTAAEQLRRTEGIDPKRIFVLGHSLGGMAAPRIGHANTNLAGLIIMAGATRPIEDLMVEQTRYILSLKGEMSPADEEKVHELESKVAAIKKLTAADASSSTLLLGAPASYWLDLRAHDAVAEAKSLKQPLLILQGGRDYQVTQIDFKNWKNGLAGMNHVTFKLYPNLNHLFVPGEGQSSPQEYEKPGHVNDAVVEDIASWIKRGR